MKSKSSPPKRETTKPTVSTVLIVGSSRGIGLETVKCALKAGHNVRALARSASTPVSHPNLEKITGDALDLGTIKEALAGVNVAIQTLGVDFSPEIIFRGTRLFSIATRFDDCDGRDRS